MGDLVEDYNDSDHNHPWGCKDNPKGQGIGPLYDSKDLGNGRRDQEKKDAESRRENGRRRIHEKAFKAYDEGNIQLNVDSDESG
jgi:hypothetical protein